MSPKEPFPHLVVHVAEARERVGWALRGRDTWTREAWSALSSREDLGPGLEIQLLLGWAEMTGAESLEGAIEAAAILELLRVAGLLHAHAAGLHGLALGEAELELWDELRLGDKLLAEALLLATEREDGGLARTVAALASAQASARDQELAYLRREDVTGFDAGTLGLLYGVLESRYGCAFAQASALGGGIAGAPANVLQVARDFGQSAGRAWGYLLALEERWEPEVTNQDAFRRNLVDAGISDVRGARAMVVVLDTQGQGYETETLRRWTGDLQEALSLTLERR